MEFANLLLKEFKIRMSQIQLDFIKETESSPHFWLLGLVSYQVDPDATNFIQQNLVINSVEQTASLKCSLCGEQYKKKDMEKMLPLKMIIETRNHMRKRGLNNVFPSNNLAPKRFTLLSTCRVCCTCYLLVVQENSLIDAETKMAQAQNIPVSSLPPSDTSYIRDDPNSIFRADLFMTQLYQWRSMFYAVKFSVFFIDNQTIIEEISYWRDFTSKRLYAGNFNV